MQSKTIATEYTLKDQLQEAIESVSPKDIANYNAIAWSAVRRYPLTLLLIERDSIIDYENLLVTAFSLDAQRDLELSGMIMKCGDIGKVRTDDDDYISLSLIKEHFKLTTLELAKIVNIVRSYSMVDIELPPLVNSILREYTAQTTENTIAENEGQFLEFKAGLFNNGTTWGNKLNKKFGSVDEEENSMPFKIAKAVAAQANYKRSNIGIVYIGVSEKEDGGREITGLDSDFELLGANSKKPNFDSFEQILVSKLKAYLGVDIIQTIKISELVIDGKSICRIEIIPSNKFFILKRQYDKQELFFVREGSSSQFYPVSRAIEYVTTNAGTSANP
ncbi:MAG: ATP-binding protein [Candidatus Margulisbacteria bacterium]|jgi:hypothetical protein|nr:ATP-binding protein [Candidatus Margulisiibacteriota bacterium]